MPSKQIQFGLEHYETSHILTPSTMVSNDPGGQIKTHSY